MLFFALFFLEIILLFFLSSSMTKALASLVFRLTKREGTTIYVLSFLFLPGVIIHELSHMLSAAILFVPVGEIEFVPKISEHGVKLGSAAIGRTDPMRRAFIGFSPVLVGISLLLFVLFSLQQSLPQWQGAPLLNTESIGIALLTLYSIFVIANTMFSSKKDLEGTLELLLVLLLLGGVLYAMGVRLPEGLLRPLLSEEVALFMQRVVGALLVPIVLDSIVYVAARFLLRR